MKIEANMTVRKNNETQVSFVSGVGVIQGGTQAVEFTINNTDADQAMVSNISTLIAAFRAKRLMPVLEITGGTIAEKPEMVKANGATPAHTKTWAGKPVHALKGDWSFTVVDAVALPPLPVASMAPDAMSKAVEILNRF